MTVDLAFIWAGLIAFAVLAYVIFDGFDLGLGILYPFAADEAERDTMMNSVAPVWDGNETWLVLGGGGLMAVFPLAYAVILPALYAPLTVMLLGLIFRGVAFEFRWRSIRNKRAWDWSFALGSLVATLAQGIALGALIQGIEVSGRAYAGGWWDWLTPFSVLTAVALVVGYAMLGATWLVLKTEGALQAAAYRWSVRATIGTVVLIGIVSLWTPLLSPVFMQRWLAFPAILYVAPVPLLVVLCTGLLLRDLNQRRELSPFLYAVGLFVLCYAGLGISLYPYIVPHAFTIWDAAAPDTSLSFLLAGAVVLIPLILAYTTYSYWVFRGKVDTKASYH